MPVSRLNTVLLPAFGLPTSTIVPAVLRGTDIDPIGIATSRSALIPVQLLYPEPTRLVLAQRDGGAVHTEFQRISAK